MNELALLLSSFDVSLLQTVAYAIAKVIAMTLSPTLFIIAIAIRLTETQVDALVGSGKYGQMLRDVLLWGFVLSTYALLGALILDFMNAIYTWLDSFGSLKATMEIYGKIMERNAIDQQVAGVSLMGVVSVPYVLIAALFYYGTLIIVAFLSAFLKVAAGMTFGIAFIWGLIAIPISISNTFRILRGWALLMGLALVWPIVQALLMAMFAMLFSNAAEVLMNLPDSDPTARAGNIMILFAVMNLLFCAVLISAPLIANALVSNASAAAGIVAPFAAAAVAAGLATIKGGRNEPVGGGGGGKGRGTGQNGGGGNRQLSGGGPQPRRSYTQAQPGSVAAEMSGGDDGGAPPATPVAAGAATKSAQKTRSRRGAIITQFKKRNKPEGA